MTEPKALKPLSHGNILIVGAKQSNFDEEILTHPRVILWSSQQEHWTNKDLPSNVQAVFVTRWIGHAAFGKIIAEARKRQITMFNPEGTGMIAKQVKELLAMTKPVETIAAPIYSTVPVDRKVKVASGYNSKLHVLIPHIDWNKSNTENARTLMTKMDELKITSTQASIANFIGVQRKKHGISEHRRNTHAVPTHTATPRTKKVERLDVAVQMLDDAITQLTDMRAFLVATTEENTKLRARLDMFKKALAE